MNPTRVESVSAFPLLVRSSGNTAGISLRARKGGGLTVRLELSLGSGLTSLNRREMRARGDAGNPEPEAQK